MRHHLLRALPKVPAGGGEAYRYYQLRGIGAADGVLQANTFDLTELELYDSSDTLIPVSSITRAGFLWTAGSDSNLHDGTISEASRSYRSSWHLQSNQTLTFDAGSPVAAAGLRVVSLYNQPRFPPSCTVWGSNDGVAYEEIGAYSRPSGEPLGNIGSNIWDYGIAAFRQLGPPPEPPTGIATYRFYRLSGFAGTSLASNTLDLTELEMYDSDGTLIPISHAIINFGLTGGSASLLYDGVIGVSSRAYRSSWASVASPTITLDAGTGLRVPATGIRVVSLYTQPRVPASFIVSGSNDSLNYEVLGTCSLSGAIEIASSVWDYGVAAFR
jgi:hypothetical protein